MRSSFTLLAFAVGAIAQIPGLPSCAQGCIQLPANCQTTDFKCICGSSDFITNISCCVAKACSSSDQDTIIKFAQGICGSYGVALPTQATCASSSGPTAASSAMMSSTAASMNGTAAPSLTAFVVNGTVTTTATVSVTTTTTASASGASSASARTGAAAVVAPEAGVYLGGFMAGLALL